MVFLLLNECIVWKNVSHHTHKHIHTRSHIDKQYTMTNLIDARELNQPNILLIANWCWANWNISEYPTITSIYTISRIVVVMLKAKTLPLCKQISELWISFYCNKIYQQLSNFRNNSIYSHGIYKWWEDFQVSNGWP